MSSAKETLVSTLTNSLALTRVGRLDAHRKEAERLVDEALNEVPEQDTLAEWLYKRLIQSYHSEVTWEELDENDKSYFEHEAAAVRRAVARGGFKESK